MLVGYRRSSKWSISYRQGSRGQLVADKVASVS
jgi:hypothetical protein